MKNQENKVKAKSALEILKKDQQSANKDRLEALNNYRQAINYYKSIDNKYTKYSKKTLEGWFDESEWQVYSKQCEEQGMSKKFCSARFKKEQLKSKFE